VFVSTFGDNNEFDLQGVFRVVLPPLVWRQHAVDQGVDGA
jgi:hypothetical protein